VWTTGPETFSHLGNPAIPKGPVAFRPTIARGLALLPFYQWKINLCANSQMTHPEISILLILLTFSSHSDYSILSQLCLLVLILWSLRHTFCGSGYLLPVWQTLTVHDLPPLTICEFSWTLIAALTATSDAYLTSPPASIPCA